MKTFIVLQKIVSFRVNWHTLFNPQSYQLILIVHEPTLSKLAEDQKHCFAQIYSIAQFNKESIQLRVQNIIESNCDDVSIITNDELCIELAAQLREEFNIQGDRVAMVNKFLNKEENKKLVATRNINIPKYERFNPEQFNKEPESYSNQLIQKLELPIFAKPIDSVASQNTTKINTRDELLRWEQEHNNDFNYELDEFITGKLYHVDSIIKNDQILFAQVGENAYPCFDFSLGKINASITLPDHDPLYNQLIQFNEQALKALRPLPNCVTHLEIFQRPNGELVYLEVACRAPGGAIVQMHEKHCGINFEQAHFTMQMGLDFNMQLFQKGPYCAWAWFPLMEGKILGFRQLDIKSPHQIAWKVKAGENYQKAKSLIDFAGSIILWNDNYEILRRDFDYLAQLNEPAVITQLC